MHLGQQKKGRTDANHGAYCAWCTASKQDTAHNGLQCTVALDGLDGQANEPWATHLCEYRLP